jgi:hypothetical protein
VTHSGKSKNMKTTKALGILIPTSMNVRLRGTLPQHEMSGSDQSIA